MNHHLLPYLYALIVGLGWDYLPFPVALFALITSAYIAWENEH